MMYADGTGNGGVATERHLTATPYYPSHFVHGLLAEHCGSETGKHGGQSRVKVNDPVKFRPENEVYKEFLIRGVNITDYLSTWTVLEVIDDGKTGYLGLIYYNAPSKQIVLAHRSTNFALSLTTWNGITGNSGAATDVESVLMNRIVGHQAYGYLATSVAVNLAKSLDTSLSFTGHSLGAWLAELSVFYCNTVLNYENVKGVVFDGPGSAEMIEKLQNSNVRQGHRSQFDLKNLDIVSYLSAPNVVNCANGHLGCVYTVFPEIPNRVHRPGVVKPFVYQETFDAVLSIYGHDLKHILVHFDPQTGKVQKYVKVEAWPSIIYKTCNNDRNFLSNSEVIKKIALNCVLMIGGGWKTRLAIGTVEYLTSHLLPTDMTTIGSLVTLVRAFFAGKIQQDQFWLVHEYLNISEGYRCCQISDALTAFRVRFQANYELNETDTCATIKTITNKSDELLERLKKYASSNLFQTIDMRGDIYREAKYLVSLYEVNVISLTTTQISLTDRTVSQRLDYHDLTDKLKELFHRHRDNFLHFLNHVKNSLGMDLKLSSNISRFVQGEENEIPLDVVRHEINRIKNLASTPDKNTVILVQGLPSVGKTFLATLACQELEQSYGYTTRIILKKSDPGRSTPKKTYNEMTKFLRLEISKEDPEIKVIQQVHDRLREIGQKLIFFFDGVENSAEIKAYILSLPRNVMSIITTRHAALELAHAHAPHLEIIHIQRACTQELEAQVRLSIREIVMEKMKDRIIWPFLFYISLLKPEVVLIPLEPLKKINKLYDVEDEISVTTAVNILQSSSIVVRVDANYVKIDEFVREVIIEAVNSIFAEPPFSFKTLDTLCFMNFSEISTEQVVKFLQNSNLCSQTQIESLRTNLRPAQRHDFLKLLQKLLADVSDLGNLELKKFLEKIKNYFELKQFETLEKKINDFVENWRSKTEDGKRIFVKKQDPNISKFLTVFDYFINTNWRDRKVDLNYDSETDVHFPIIGITGIGKSTLINHLIGVELKCIRVGNLSGESSTMVGLGDGTIPFAPIGNDLDSETNSVKPYSHQTSEDTKIIFWDCPGFGDNHGALRQVQNSVLTKPLRQLTKCVHVLFAVHETLLGGKSDNNSFRQHAQDTIIQIMGVQDTNELRLIAHKTALVIMQSTSHNTQDYLNKFQTFKKQIEEKEQEEAETDTGEEEYHNDILVKAETNRKNSLYKALLELILSGDIKILLFSRVAEQNQILTPTSSITQEIGNIITESMVTNDNGAAVVFNFGKCVSSTGMLQILTFADLLNEYSKYCIQEICNDVNNTMKTYLSKENDDIQNVKKVLKKKLLIPLEDNQNQSSFPVDNCQVFLSDLRKICVQGQDSMPRSMKIEEIVSALNFLGENCNEEINEEDQLTKTKLKGNIRLSEWVQPILRLQEAYKYLLSELPNPNPVHDKNLVFKAPIISTSEIMAKVNNVQNTESIRITTYLFIVDEDMNLPGVDLAINAWKWIKRPNVNINLKGQDGQPGENGLDGGNFYSHTIIAAPSHGNIVQVNLSGGKGGNGGLDMPLLQRRLDLAKGQSDMLHEKLTAMNNEFEQLQISETVKKEISRISKELKNVKEALEKNEQELKDSNARKQELENYQVWIDGAISKAQNGENDSDILLFAATVNRICQNNETEPEEEETMVKLISMLQKLKEFDIHGLQEARIVVERELEKITETNRENNLKKDTLVQKYLELNAELNQALRVNTSGSEIEETYGLIATAEENIQNAKESAKEARDEYEKLQTELENTKSYLVKFIKKHDAYEQAQQNFETCKRILEEECTKWQNVTYANEINGIMEIVLQAFNNKLKAEQDFDRLLASTSQTIAKKKISTVITEENSEATTEENSETITEENFETNANTSLNGRRLLKPYQKDRDRLLNHYKYEMTKLKEEAERFEEEYTNHENQRKVLYNLVKQSLSIKIKEKIFSISPANNWGNLEFEKRANHAELQKYWNNAGWSNWFQSFLPEVTEPYGRLEAQIGQKYNQVLGALRNAQILRESYRERLRPDTVLSEGYQNLKRAHKEFSDINKYYKTRKNQVSIQAQRTLFTSYENMLKALNVLENAKREEAVAAEELLFNKNEWFQIRETNLRRRLKCETPPVQESWPTRFLNEFCLFNTKFTEEYAFSGTRGGMGGNSGKYKMKGNQEGPTMVQVIQNGGRGGEDALTLEGVYSREHSFALMRRIENSDQTSNISLQNSSSFFPSAGTVLSQSALFGNQAAQIVASQAVMPPVRALPFGGTFSQIWMGGRVLSTPFGFVGGESVNEMALGTGMGMVMGTAQKMDKSIFVDPMFKSAQVASTASTATKLLSKASLVKGLYTFGIQGVASYAVAKYRAEWIDGPYETKTGCGENGGVKQWNFDGETEEEMKSELLEFVRLVQSRIESIYPCGFN